MKYSLGIFSHDGDKPFTYVEVGRRVYKFLGFDVKNKKSGMEIDYSTLVWKAEGSDQPIKNKAPIDPPKGRNVPRSEWLEWAEAVADKRPFTLYSDTHYRDVKRNPYVVTSTEKNEAA